MSRDYQAPQAIDHLMTRTLKLGMSMVRKGDITISYLYDFEIFGAYENWRGGWVVEDKVRGITTQSCSIEAALNKWASRVAAQ